MERHTDTIAATATGEGGAIAVIRVSGPVAIAACDGIFTGVKGKKLAAQRGFSLLYGNISDGGNHIDDVLVSVFHAPNSYTGEDMVEISCHGSPYIKGEIMRLLSAAGVRPAEAGEFTMRAFLNGRMDLSQAEAVADVIASESRRAHELAVSQMRGGYSHEFNALRNRLVELASLLELELDFSEEDVEFAGRETLLDTITAVKGRIMALKDSFALGNVIKDGVPVAIAGSPNVGKSTLLNLLLKDDRAMVSDIAGTTRDVVEDTMNIDGVRFRLIDTAGIRRTEDTLEAMGIERTLKRVKNASIVLLVADATQDADTIIKQVREIDISPDGHIAVVINKIDKGFPNDKALHIENATGKKVIAISAKEGTNIRQLTDYLYVTASSGAPKGDVVVYNARHYEALERALESIASAESALAASLSGASGSGLFPTDLLAEEIRNVIHHMGLITGHITTDDLLTSIFSKFCIGK